MELLPGSGLSRSGWREGPAGERIVGLSGARAVERNRSLERDVEGAGTGLVTVLDVGCEERGWSREDPTLGSWWGSWLLGGAMSNGEQ